mmetsp:Transcript_37273/g.57227  ORF Transcript_37273/g.57227 Transcript_37273/m.57227 type:complete len:261 (+) Transcript_37273:42-824(+)|eukprot:CAMPEP_0118698076 /NCGR_PEP_ID=MMETSP0800-20121206/14964_1 /TAXON_ID=210618 ORGANISM="Striatella unipunctata, Strain CCMP2910" /NCGR_SAMPLE_ID=MMETSP0800 /ASSEMBLY_ACC=CAM_ASM_000638 /LENGTH=260 /DNA_ID=CAMNT_0006597785 /DNA_START=37 /DNA_END=819 /DNA_ORIENTATION=-
MLGLRSISTFFLCLALPVSDASIHIGEVQPIDLEGLDLFVSSGEFHKIFGHSQEEFQTEILPEIQSYFPKKSSTELHEFGRKLKLLSRKKIGPAEPEPLDGDSEEDPEEAIFFLINLIQYVREYGNLDQFIVDLLAGGIDSPVDIFLNRSTPVLNAVLSVLTQFDLCGVYLNGLTFLYEGLGAPLDTLERLCFAGPGIGLRPGPFFPDCGPQQYIFEIEFACGRVVGFADALLEWFVGGNELQCVEACEYYNQVFCSYCL